MDILFLFYSLLVSSSTFGVFFFHFSPNFRFQKHQTSHLSCELNYHDQKIRRTLTHDIQNNWAAVSTLLSLISSFPSEGQVHNLLFTICGQPGQQSLQLCKFSSFFFLLIIIRFVRLADIFDRFVYKNSRGVCVSHFQGQMMGCVYTLYSYGQI